MDSVCTAPSLVESTGNDLDSHQPVIIPPFAYEAPAQQVLQVFFFFFCINLLTVDETYTNKQRKNSSDASTRTSSGEIEERPSKFLLY